MRLSSRSLRAAAAALVAVGASFASPGPPVLADELPPGGPADGAPPAEPVTIQILGITDLHGHVEASTNPRTGAVVDPGAVTLACEVAAARSARESALFVSVGDNIGGSAYTSAILDDKPTLDVLNAMRTDVSAVGNHEFDKGVEDMDHRVLPAADFPYLSANAYTPALAQEGNGNGTFIKEVDGVKVGFVGVVTDELDTLIAPATYDRLTITPAVATAQARASELKVSGAADVVVVLAHADAASLAGSFNGDVDAVLGGHSHLTYPDPAAGQTSVGTTTDGQPIAIVQPDHYGWKLADISLSYDPVSEAVSVLAATNKDLQASTCTTDAYGVAGIVAQASAQAKAKGDIPLASIGSDFLRGVSRGTESTASNLIADSFAAWASSSALPATDDPVVGLMNAGGVRADYLYARSGSETADGVLTIGEAQTVQPFGNEMSYATLTGAQLKALLAQQWQPGADRQVLTLGTSSNVAVLIDQAAADELYAIQAELAAGALSADAAAPRIAQARERVITSVTVDGRELTDADTVRVVSNSFVMTGGDGYTVLKDPAIQAGYVNTGTLDRDVTGIYLSSAPTPLKAAYVKHQVGFSAEPSAEKPRSASIRMTGLSYSAESERSLGATQVRYAYDTASGQRVTSAPVPIDTTPVDNTPETGQVRFDLVFGEDAATQACRTITDDSGAARSCYMATIELLDASGAVLSSLSYELTAQADATAAPTSPQDAAVSPGAPGSSVVDGGSASGTEVVAQPGTGVKSNQGRLSSTGVSIGIGVLAIILLAVGGLLLLRRRREDPDEGPDGADDVEG